VDVDAVAAAGAGAGAGAGSENAAVESAIAAALESNSATVLVVIVIPLQTVGTVLCANITPTRLSVRYSVRVAQRCNPIASPWVVVLPHFGALKILESRPGNALFD
jgi:CBS domain containing-hemolysin-like protein